MLSPDLKKFINDNVSSPSRFKSYSLFLDIAADLHELRKSKNLTQRDLAELINTSYSTIARWENPGYTGYSLSKLTEIADALEADVQLKIVPRKETVTSMETVKKERWNFRSIMGSFKLILGGAQ